MPLIQFQCPLCRQPLTARSEFSGTAVPCPHCRQFIIIQKQPPDYVSWQCPHCQIPMEIPPGWFRYGFHCPLCGTKVRKQTGKARKK